jgi:hypothetical protein
MGADPVLDDARHILDWIARTRSEAFTRRDLFSALDRKRFAKVTDLDPALDLLEAHGHIRRAPEPERTKRESGDGPPSELAPVIRWLEKNTVTLAALEDETTGPVLVRQALNALALRLDGKQAAANTIARKRAVFYNVLEYAVELRACTAGCGTGGSGYREEPLMWRRVVRWRILAVSVSAENPVAAQVNPEGDYRTR